MSIHCQTYRALHSKSILLTGHDNHSLQNSSGRKCVAEKDTFLIAEEPSISLLLLPCDRSLQSTLFALGPAWRSSDHLRC